MQYQYTLMEDYDQKVKLDGEQILCYSKKQLDKLYPDGGYRIIGESKNKNKKKIIAQLRVRKIMLEICHPDQHSGLLYRRAGYVRVSGDEFIALLAPRWPFLLILLGLLVALAVLAGLLLNPKEPVTVNPNHPAPVIDPNSALIEDDDSEKAQAAEGGGSLSMIYMLEAELTLSTGDIEIYFKNPNASTHNVSIELFVLNGEERVSIARSGLIATGSQLSKLTMTEGSAQLSEGIYKGLYVLSCYDPLTGERALVQPEITGVELTVRN
jgi:hypothetical protein